MVQRHRSTRAVTAVAALAAACVVAGCNRSPVPPADESLVGAWRSTVQFKTGAFAAVQDLEFMYVFNAGGTLTESSNYDGAPPVPPAYGAWRAVGPQVFEARYEFFVTAPSPDVAKNGWLPSGRGVLTERITVARDGQTFTSTIAYEALDAKGKRIDGGGDGEARGVRMDVSGLR